MELEGSQEETGEGSGRGNGAPSDQGSACRSDTWGRREGVRRAIDQSSSEKPVPARQGAPRTLVLVHRRAECGLRSNTGWILMTLQPEAVS